LFNEISIIEEFKIDPFTYDELHRWDKKLLYYYLLMKRYYDEVSMEKIRKDSDVERKQAEMVKNAPKVARRRK